MTHNSRKGGAVGGVVGGGADTDITPKKKKKIGENRTTSDHLVFFLSFTIFI